MALCEASPPIALRTKHLHRLLSGIKNAALVSQDIEHVLALGQLYGRLLWANPVGTYRDDAFEAALVPLVNELVPLTPKLDSTERILHVISTPYKAGGHTRLMERLYKFEPDRSDLLVTRPCSDLDLALRLPADAVVHHLSQGYDLVSLVEIISAYRIVCLHVHPDDLQAAVAVGVAKLRTGSRIIFVNHADHVFSFGFYSADVVAEVSSFGQALSHFRRNEVPSSFLGISLDCLRFLPIEAPSAGARYIISAASPHKFKPANGYSFPRLATAILKAIPGATLVVIGPKQSNRWWWLARLRFPLRLKIYPVVPYESYLALMRKADVYLDSLPMTGGTAVPEVRSQGIAVTGLKTGALGYSPFDQTKFQTQDELIHELIQFFKGDGGCIVEANNSPTTLNLALSAHSFEAVGARFQEIIRAEGVPVGNMQRSVHDLSFYERQWQEWGIFNLDNSSKRQILALLASGNHSLLPHLLGVATGRQRIRILLDYFSEMIKLYSRRFIFSKISRAAVNMS